MTAALLAYDAALLLLTCLLYGGSAWATWQLISWAQLFLPIWALILLWPCWLVCFCLCLICGLWLLRLPVPAVPEGKFAAPGSPGFWLWTWHFSLRRLIAVQPLYTVIHWSAILRWLAYRALGMRLAFASSMSSDVIILDPGLLEMGSRSVLGARTLVGCHYMNKYPDGDKLITARTRLGVNVNIGVDCVISPGVEVGDNTTVGTQSMLSPFVKVGKNVTIKPFTTVPPKMVIPDGVTYPEPRPESHPAST